MKNFSILFLFLSSLVVNLMGAVPLYRVHEVKIENSKFYPNKFVDVTLNVQYNSPSDKIYFFPGFFDGNGKGLREGHVWKMRFLPDEVGTWTYLYSWSDGTKGGEGTFSCVADGAGKGILQPYALNPHWFAYRGTEPVWLKSYYETGHGSLGQDINWVKDNVYLPLIKAGYNHLQVNWLLSLCCVEQYYKDGPDPETLDLLLYQEGDLFGTMNLDVWRRMEQHLGWLNEQNVNVHMFLGVDGSKNNGPAWGKLTLQEKEKFTEYMVARLAPYANLAGWNFVWEVPGDRMEYELGFASLVSKYDIFNHLRTYEDETPRSNEFYRPEYTFAAIENHKIASDSKDSERNLWKEPWTHHMACLLGYEGKPVFMSEGNALWRRFWQQRTHATRDDLRRAAWACVTAGASFTWCGHAGEEELYAAGPEGLPFNNQNPYSVSESQLALLSKIMTDEVEFYRMKPADELLYDYPALEVYALAEPGNQYLIFSPKGTAFSLHLDPGFYSKVIWIDVITGVQTTMSGLSISDESKAIPFVPPGKESDFVLIIKKVT